MGVVELLLIAVGLSMDAFAVAVGKGLCAKDSGTRHAVIAGAYFGIFQAVMPLIGYFFGEKLEGYISAFDHWIVFGVLTVIGLNMIRESFSKEERGGNGSFAFKPMIVMALATSIDALAVGITFAFLDVSISIFTSVLIIGAMHIFTFVPRRQAGRSAGHTPEKRRGDRRRRDPHSDRHKNTA